MIQFDRIGSWSSFLFEHDLFRKPVPTFRDHALAGIVGGIACAIALPIWLGRRDRARAAGTLQPAKPWPLALKLVIAAIVTAVTVYYATWSVLWIKGPMSFSTYWAAFAVGMSPIVLGLVAAAIAAWLVYRSARQSN